MDINREELAWAAGLFEGEGCFSMSLRAGRSISAQLGMTDEDVVRRFQHVIGFGEIYDKLPKGHKRQWAWKVGSFEQVQAVAAFLWPWLQMRRRARIQEILVNYKKAEPTSVRLTASRTAGIKKALALLSDVPLWGRRWKQELTQGDIAREFFVSEATVSFIKKEGALRPLTR